MTESQKAYQDYLQTDKWKTIRAQRLAMDNNQCVLCGESASHVHHRRYPKTWGTETVNDLVSLCSICHGRHHADVSGDENDLNELGKLIGKFDRHERGWIYDVISEGWRYPSHAEFVAGFNNVVKDMISEEISPQIEGMATSLSLICYAIVECILGVKSELGMNSEDVDSIFNNPIMKHAKRCIEDKSKAKEMKSGCGKS